MSYKLAHRSYLPSCVSGHEGQRTIYPLKGTESINAPELYDNSPVPFSTSVISDIFDYIQESAPFPESILDTVISMEDLVTTDDIFNRTWRHTKRFALRLIFYRNSFKDFGLRPEDIFRLCLHRGPLFAKQLKDIRQIAMMSTLSIRPTSQYIEWAESAKRELAPFLQWREESSYDYFFHEQHLIPFEESANDFHWAFKPVEVGDNFYYLFRRTARDLLDRYFLSDIKQVCTEDYRTWISDSVTIHDGAPILNRKLMRQLASDDELLSEIEISKKTKHTFYRKSVFVSPANARDTWQCDLRTLFKVKRVSHLMRQVIEPIPYSAMCSPEKAYTRRKRVLKSDSIFAMFDYKKCGLTVNRELLAILGEELERIYPGMGFDELTSIRDVTVYDGSVPRSPERGVGLGNCNEGITLIQCIFGHLLNARYGCDSVYFNDDGVITIDSESKTTRFGNILSLLRQSGMIINLKKTMISDCNVFCEDYIVHKNNVSYEKLQNLIIPLAECFFDGNIVQAKRRYNSITSDFIGRNIVVDILPSLIDRWGYEFHPSEYFWPFEMGGWIRYGRSSVNEILSTYFDPGYLQVENRGPIPLYREWFGFQVHFQDISDKLGRTRIEYSKKVRNPFIGIPERESQSEVALKIIEQLGYVSNEELSKSYDDLYNLRGLKNAKPAITQAKYKKLARERLALWRRFREYRRQNLVPRFDRNVVAVLRCLSFLERATDAPSLYMPPRCIFREWIKLDNSNSYWGGRVMVSTYGGGHINHLGATRALESIQSKRVRHLADFESLRNLYLRKREGRIRSNNRIRMPSAEGEYPGWIYRFFPSRKIADAAFSASYGEVPIIESYKELDDLHDLLISPISRIFPECTVKYNRIMRVARDHGLASKIAPMLSERAIYNSGTFNQMLDVVEGFLPGLISVPEGDRSEYTVDEDFNEVFHFDQDHLEEILGSLDEEELLEEEAFLEQDAFDDDEGIIYFEEEIHSDYDDDFWEVEDPARSYFSSMYEEEDDFSIRTT